MTDLEDALTAAIDERDRLHHELGQVVRELAGYSAPDIVRVVNRARRALELIAPPEPTP